MQPAAVAVNTTANKPPIKAPKASWLRRLLWVGLTLLMLLTAMLLALPHALPWLLQQQGIDFQWENFQWQRDGFSIEHIQFRLPSNGATFQQLQLRHVTIEWAWQTFPIQTLRVARLQANWPLNTQQTTHNDSALVLPEALLKWLPQHIELQEIDANLVGMGRLHGSLNLHASEQGLLWQPSFIHSQLTVKDLHGRWLDSIPVEFQPSQLTAQISTHPEQQQHANDQQVLAVDVSSEGPMRLQLNGRLELQQLPNWQGALKNAQLTVQLDALEHPQLQAKQVHLQSYVAAQANSERFAISLNQGSTLEAHQLQFADITQAQKATVDLSGLRLQGFYHALEQLEVHSPFTAAFEQLSTAQLHPQNWQLSGLLSGQMPQIEATGQLTGEHGLSLSSQVQRLKDSLQGSVTVKEILFKSDNPLQKTFADWPESLILDNGRLRSHIDFSLASSAPLKLSINLNISELNAALDQTKLNNLNLDFNGKVNLTPTHDWQAELYDAQLLVQLASLTEPNLSAENLQAQAQFSAQVNAEKFTINFEEKTQLEAHKLQLPELAEAQKATVHLADLSLHGPSSSPHQVKLRSSITAHFQQLSAEPLHRQNWDFSGNLSGQLAQLKLSGNLASQQGLNLATTIDLLENSVQGSATVKEIFFKAGNPLQKTLKDWPELVLLDSGRLRGQIDFTLPHKGSMKLALRGNASGLNGIINRSELKNLSLDFNGQLLGQTLSLSLPSLSIDQLDPGIPLGPIVLTDGQYRSHLDDLLHGTASWQHVQASLLNGRAWLGPQQLDLSRPQQLLLQLEGLELQELFRVYPAEGLAGNGIIDGTLPIFIDQNTLYIEAGQLQARGPGVLQFQSEKIQALGRSNPAMAIVADALDDFHFNLLTSGLSYDQSGKLILDIRLEGQNPDVEKGRPIHLNVNLEDNIPALLASIQLSGQVSEIIQKRVRERLKQR